MCRTVIAGRVWLRDKSEIVGIHADPFLARRRPELAGKKRATAPAGNPGYGWRHVVKDNGGKT